MFAYIKGSLEEKSNSYVVIDVNGIGYKVFMSQTAIEKMEDIHSIIKVYTYYYVREDNISLYGFLTNEELKMFELLLSVSGIGAKSAIAMLSEITPSDFAFAIISNDVSKLVKIQGIGNKTAARIILELKDKLKTEQALINNETKSSSIQADETISEAISALQMLGYNRKEIDKALQELDAEKLGIEGIIKQALKILSTRKD